MALTSSVLSSALQSLTPTTSESIAIQRLTDAWEDYFLGATVNLIALNPASISAGLGAFQSALSGLSQAGQGAAKFASAIAAFWSAQASLATSMWTTAPVVLVPPIVAPPGLGGLQGNLQNAFDSNVASELENGPACDAVATVIHAASLGATVLGSIPPTTPVAIQIL